MQAKTQSLQLLIAALSFAALAGCVTRPVDEPGKQIVRKPFGSAPDGTPVDLFILCNKDAGKPRAEVAICTYGGIVTWLKVPDRNGRMGDVVLGHLIDGTPAADERRRSASPPACEIYVVIADEPRRADALRVVQEARDLGWRVDFSLKPAKVGRQFQDAEALGAARAVLVGSEWPSVKIKTLATRHEEAFDQTELTARLGRPGAR